MNKPKKGLIFILLTGALVLAINVKGFPYVWHNGVGTAYIEPLAKQGTVDDAIEGKIIAAAGHFLAGRAQIQKLLVMIELKDVNGLNSATLDPVIGAALYNIQQAKGFYQQIIKRADMTPYNSLTLNQLKRFPYEELQGTEGLNRTIFAKVKTFLKNGNVTGVFKSSLKQLNTMISLLKQIKKDFAAGRVPAIALFWQLNETAAENAIFGSYVARVFAQVK